MANDRSFLEEEALGHFLAGQSAIENEANTAKVSLAPISTPEGKYQRGLINQDGSATDSGKLLVNLRDAGLYDDEWRTTAKGHAFSMDRAGSLLQENLPYYKIRRKAGLDDAPETSLGEDIGNVAGFVWDGVKGFSKLANMSRLVSTPFSQTARDEETLLAQSAAKGVISGGAQLGSGGLEMVQKWMSADDSDEYWAAEQAADRRAEDIKDISGGEIYGHLVGSQQAVDRAVAAREGATNRLGPDQAAQLEQQGEAAGQLFGDPANYLTAGVGGMVGAGEKAGILARLGTKVDDAMQAGLRSSEAAAALAKAESQAMKARNGAALAAQQAENLRSVGRIERATGFEQVERRLAVAADEADSAIPALRGTMQGSAAEAQRLIDASGGAQKILGQVESLKAAGRQLRAAPAKIAAPILETIGAGMEKLDSSVGAIRRLRDAAAVVGISTGNPMLAVPAAIHTAGPVLRQLGSLSRVIGDELAQVRGTVPFWRRVAENSAATPLAKAVGHGMDFATLGGKVPSVIGRTARGVAAAMPMNVAFDAISQGGDLSPDSLRRGFAQSLVFAGPAAMGGAIVRGHRNDLLARQAGDEINFRQRLSPEQKGTYSRMDAGTRKMASTYAAAFPALRFEFTEDGPSSFDRQTNTARVNVRQGDALRPLLSHEVNHFIEAGGQIGEGVRSMLLGDAENGGILRSKNGKLDANFQAFGDAYNKRLQNEGRPPLAIDDMALEYFNEATVNRLMEDLGSGRLQERKSMSQGERAIGKAIDAVIPKVPILRNLYLRTGGALDGAGRVVRGNGILAEGVRNTPGMTALMRKGMEKAFSRNNSPEPLKPAINVQKAAADPVVRDTLFSEFETDANGNVVTDANGRAKPLSPEAQEAKATETAEVARKEIDNEIVQEADTVEGKSQPEPIADPVLDEFEKSETPQQKQRRAKPSARGKYEGTHLSARVLLALRKTLNPQQFKNLLMLNRASRDMSGETFHTLYNPATKRDKGGNPVYASRGPESYEVIPYAVHVNKKGGVFFELLDVRRMMDNLRTRAASESGKSLYHGSEPAILQDLEAMVNLRRDGQPTDGYFQSKYGDGWRARKNFVSSIFGNFKDKVQLESNPEITDAGMTYKDTNTVKTFRIDRLNQTDRLQGRVLLPFNYPAAKINLFPRGPMDGNRQLVEPSEIRSRATAEPDMATIRPQVGSFSRDIGLNGPGNGWDAARGMSRNAARALDNGKLVESDFRQWAGEKLGGAAIPVGALKAGNSAAKNLHKEYHHVGKQMGETSFYDPSKFESSPRFWLGVADWFAENGNSVRSRKAMKMAEEALAAFENPTPEAPSPYTPPLPSIDRGKIEKSITRRREQLTKWEPRIKAGEKPPYDGYLESQYKALADEESQLRDQ